MLLGEFIPKMTSAKRYVIIWWRYIHIIHISLFSVSPNMEPWQKMLNFQLSCGLNQQTKISKLHQHWALHYESNYLAVVKIWSECTPNALSNCKLFFVYENETCNLECSGPCISLHPHIQDICNDVRTLCLWNLCCFVTCVGMLPLPVTMAS